MAEEKPRRRTIPIGGPEFQWWTDAVKTALGEAHIDQKALAELIGAEPPEVSRCIRRSKPVYELLIAISDALKIAYPVILPESKLEAEHLARERRLFRRDLQAAQIRPGVAKISVGDQTKKVPSEHVQRAAKSRPKRVPIRSR